jgi:hypothetical protein
VARESPGGESTPTPSADGAGYDTRPENVSRASKEKSIDTRKETPSSSKSEMESTADQETEEISIIANANETQAEANPVEPVYNSTNEDSQAVTPQPVDELRGINAPKETSEDTNGAQLVETRDEPAQESITANDTATDSKGGDMSSCSAQAKDKSDNMASASDPDDGLQSEEPEPTKLSGANESTTPKLESEVASHDITQSVDDCCINLEHTEPSECEYSAALGLSEVCGVGGQKSAVDLVALLLASPDDNVEFIPSGSSVTSGEIGGLEEFKPDMEHSSWSPKDELDTAVGP